MTMRVSSQGMRGNRGAPQRHPGESQGTVGQGGATAADLPEADGISRGVLSGAVMWAVLLLVLWAVLS